MGNTRMWLNYGVDESNKLVAIEDVASGRTVLRCPYCGRALIAKKGKVKEHHFAHDGVMYYTMSTTFVIHGF